MSEKTATEIAMTLQPTIGEVIFRLTAANAALEHSLSHVELKCTEWEHRAHELEARIAELTDERDIFKRTLDKRDAELAEAREDLSVNRECYYQVVAQRNEAFKEVARVEQERDKILTANIGSMSFNEAKKQGQRAAYERAIEICEVEEAKKYKIGSWEQSALFRCAEAIRKEMER